MPLKESEAIVLRSYPLREADLLVTFFTREEGKLRGVARSAKKSRKRFGGALEPLTRVRLYYDDRDPGASPSSPRGRRRRRGTGSRCSP